MRSRREGKSVFPPHPQQGCSLVKEDGEKGNGRQRSTTEDHSGEGFLCVRIPPCSRSLDPGRSMVCHTS